MASFIYARDQIRRNLNPHISGSTRTNGYQGIATQRDAWSVAAAL